MSNKISGFLLLVFLSVFIPTVAQTRSREEAVRINPNLVLIDAVVTRNGKAVKDLTPKDFEIFEDGRRQQISSFAYVPNEKRRTIALVVDDYGLSERSMTHVRQQLRKFIDQNLQADDQVAIILTSHADQLVLTHFGNDRRLIDEAWNQLVWNQCSRVGAGEVPPLNKPHLPRCEPSIATREASLRGVKSAVETMSKLAGRKSLVLFSDNLPLKEDDLSSAGDLNRLPEMAIRSSVVIYAVDPGSFRTAILDEDIRNRNHPPPYVASEYKTDQFIKFVTIERRRKAAKLMVEQTGGFFVRDQKLFQLDDILQDQSGYYLIGYHPDMNTFNKHFHTFKARVKKSGMTVRTRSGFFGVTDEEAKRGKQTSGQ